MLGYYKLLVVALLLLTASALANADEISRIEESVELMEELISTKDNCLPSQHICSAAGPPQQCCSRSCVPHPVLRIFVCK